MRALFILIIIFVYQCSMAQCPLGTGVSGLELVTNGNFEQGNVGFTSQYTYCNTAGCLNPESRYTVASNPNFYHTAFNGNDHTTGTGNFMIINGAGTPNTSVWCQTITVTPNTQYLFSTWVCSVVASSPALLQFNINGNSIGPIFSAPNQTFQWLPFNATWNSGNNTSATICIINQNTNLGGNDFGLDDISFQPCTCNFQAPQLTVQSICPGASVTVDAQSIATDYLWSPANGVSCITCAVTDFSPLNTTIYTLISSLNNCSDTTTLLIQVVPDAIADAGEDLAICNGQQTQLSGTGNGTFLWSPAVGLSSSTLASPTANPTSTTTYTLTVTTANGCTAQDEVVVTIFDGFTLIVSGNTTICPGTNTTLTASGANAYLWSPDIAISDINSSTPTVNPTTTTTYTVVATDNDGCTADATIVVNTYPVTYNADFDTTVCKGEPLTLSAPHGTQFNWYVNQQLISTSSTATPATLNNSTITLNYQDENSCEAVKVYHIVIDNGCDFIIVPSAFSPNGDGKNDVFRIIKAGVISYTLSVYNRWGQLIFQTNDLSGGWDGNINGAQAEVGTYVYMIQAQLQNGEVVNAQGNVTLLR